MYTRLGIAVVWPQRRGAARAAAQGIASISQGNQSQRQDCFGKRGLGWSFSLIFCLWLTPMQDCLIHTVNKTDFQVEDAWRWNHWFSFAREQRHRAPRNQLFCVRRQARGGRSTAFWWFCVASQAHKFSLYLLKWYVIRDMWMCDTYTPSPGLESPWNVLDLLLLHYFFAQVYVLAPKCLWNVSDGVYRFTVLKARESLLINYSSLHAIAPAWNALTWFWLQQVFWSYFETIHIDTESTKRNNQYALCALKISVWPLLLSKK